MSHKRRVLFFAEAVTLAHVARPFVLASALDPTAHEICIARDPRFQRLFSSHGFALKDLYSISCERFARLLAQGRPIYCLRTLRRYVQDDLRLIEEFEPAVVVGDFRLSLAVSAAVAKVPYITIANAYWSPYARQRVPVPELPVTRLTGLRVAQALFDLIRPLAFAHHSRPLSCLRREYGLPDFGGDLRRAYTEADYTLYADIPGLIPLAPLPPNHCLLGPVLWSPDVPEPQWWRTLPIDRPVVYVTLGSSGAAYLLPRILDALGGLPVTAVIATAGRIQLPDPPKNVLVAEYLPGDDAVARSRLVICNGGSPTTQQALCAGRPVIGLPSNLDQFLNMQAVERSGAGILLRPHKMTPAALAAAIRQLIDDARFARAARELGQRCGAGDAGVRFAGLIGRLPR